MCPAGAGARDPDSRSDAISDTARTKDQHHVRLLEARPHHGRAPVAGHAQVARVVVGHHVRAPPRRDDGHSQGVGEGHESLARPRAKDPAAGDDDASP